MVYGNIINQLAFVWNRARQYYWLQKECKVKERLLVELQGINLDGAVCDTCIYDKEKINHFFKENPKLLIQNVKAIIARKNI